MRRQVRSLLSVLAVLASSAAISSATTIDFVGVLGGDQEVAPVVSAGSGSLTGTLIGDFGSNDFVFTYSITYAGLGSAIAVLGPVGYETGGFFHSAPAGANGAVVHPLDTIPFDYTGTTSGNITGNWRFDDADFPLTEAIAQDLIDGNIYVNLHTVNELGGEIRGQLYAVPEPGSILLVGFGLAGVIALRRRRVSAQG